MIVQGEALEIGEDLLAEERLHVQRRARRMARPDGAEALGHRHFGEVQAGAVDTLEAVAMGDAA
ncbi:hypothetical protein D3C78_1748500 [compost metagenome]